MVRAALERLYAVERSYRDRSCALTRYAQVPEVLCVIVADEIDTCWPIVIDALLRITFVPEVPTVRPDTITSPELSVIVAFAAVPVASADASEVIAEKVST